MKQKPFKYFTLRPRSMVNVFDFTSMDDLKRFAECNTIKDVFVLQSDDGVLTHFALFHNNYVLQIATEGYSTIEDYYASAEGLFPDAASYYEAAAAGYTRYHHHLLVKTAGITDKALFEQMMAAGFIEGFVQYTTEGVGFIPATITNAWELFNDASAKGFATFKDYYDALKHGFENNEEYTMARADGFPSKADLDEGRLKGFKTYAVLDGARKLTLRDVADHDTFFSLLNLKCSSNGTLDRRVLISFISKLHEGTSVHIDKLVAAFRKELDTYKYPDTNELPKWLTTSLSDENAVIDFLQTSEDTHQFGTYNEKTKHYNVNHIKDRMVVIDGSNVAHNSQGKANSIPYYSNIIRMVEYLKEKGIISIKVYTDFSLRHTADDKANLEKLKALVDFDECPPETTADTFLINYVKQHRCLLVTNDQFENWKLTDTWTDENIDRYALRFRIYPNHVSIRDLEEPVVS
jgi:hypothetical protein